MKGSSIIRGGTRRDIKLGAFFKSKESRKKKKRKISNEKFSSYIQISKEKIL